MLTARCLRKKSAQPLSGLGRQLQAVLLSFPSQLRWDGAKGWSKQMRAGKAARLEPTFWCLEWSSGTSVVKVAHGAGRPGFDYVWSMY